MSAQAHEPRCDDCGTTIGDIRQDHDRGGYVCGGCYGRRGRNGLRAVFDHIDARAVGDGSKRLRARTADASRVRPFRWAWEYRLLIGYLNLIVGDEGVGKSTFAAWMIARLTRGELPGDLRGQPVRVLVVGDEDGFDNVTVPRLIAAGADLDKVLDLPIGDDGPLDLRHDTPELRDLCRTEGIGAVYIEQFLDVLGVGVDDFKAKPVREAVGPFRRLAAELDLILLASLHTNKSRTGTFRERVAGTQQFNALSRSSLLVAQHPEDEDRRVVARGKGNYSKRPPALEFGISSTTLEINGYRIDVGLVDGITESNLTVDQILGQPRENLTKADHGRQVITDELADGEWHKASEVLAALADAGIADREARRLATDVGVERRKSAGFPSHAEWRLARGGLPVYLSSRCSQSAISRENATPATPATPVDRQHHANSAAVDDADLERAERFAADYPEAAA